VALNTIYHFFMIDIKALIFDITGVLFPHQPWVGQRPSKEKLFEIKQVAIDIYDKDKISKSYLKKEIFRTARPQKELEAIFDSLTVIDEDLFELIKKLSKKHDLYSIANEAPKWTDIRKDLYEFEKYFKKLFISIEVGMSKPDENIYQLFLAETGLKPNECLFIDDKKINIETAQKLGFQTHLYVNFNQFKKFATDISLLK